ncbi:MAG: T9SS type A sorting domain-containing protein [Bacteroidia bacterium]
MKNTLLLSAASLIAGSLFSQTVIRHPDGSYYKQCTSFSISRPLREIAKEYPVTGRKDGVYKQAADNDAHRRFPYQILKHRDGAEKTITDSIVQKAQGTTATEGTIVSVDGQSSSQGYVPYDPNGMVGPNNYVQAINSDYQVFDKSGTALTPSFALSHLFPGSTDDGDPVVMYDKFADRWVIEEFQSDNNGNETEMQFAVSTTPDPTGTYYIYDFTPDANDFADYPKFSIWSDGYYETCNCQNQKVVVYQRAKMITGDPTAGFIVIPSIYMPAGSGGGFWCPQTLYADGTLPPYGSPEYLFDFTSASWGGNFTDKIRIYKITTDWTNKTGAIALSDSLTTQPSNCIFTGGQQDIDQPGNPNSLDALDGFFSYRIPYLRWGTYNAAVMCNPVNVGTGSTIVSGLRWYELRQDATSNVWSIYQQGTYAPNDGVSRWNPSIAMDQNGSIGLAYSVSDPTSVYPGIRYTGRRKCDPLGTMSLTEGIGVAGSSAFTQASRWGDYANTTVDPSDGVTFWHTNMYVAAGGYLSTRIFSFKVPICTSGTGIATLTNNQVTLNAFQSGDELSIKAKNLPTNSTMILTLYDVQGKYISGKTVMPTANALQTTISTSGIAKGLYFVRLGNNDFQRVLKVIIQ